MFFMPGFTLGSSKSATKLVEILWPIIAVNTCWLLRKLPLADTAEPFIHRGIRVCSLDYS